LSLSCFKCFKLSVYKNVVMVTLTIGIMFLLFTCMHFWVWGIFTKAVRVCSDRLCSVPQLPKVEKLWTRTWKCGTVFVSWWQGQVAGRREYGNGISSFALMMKAVRTSETSVCFKWRYIPGGSHLHKTRIFNSRCWR
jgi:hypothetical protein